MENDYFVLRADKPLVKNQSYYSIPKLKDNFMGVIPMTPPTPVSVQNRHLEWIIPNNAYNQSFISQHYRHFKILKAGEEAILPDVPLMDGLPPIPEKSEVDDEVVKALTTPKAPEKSDVPNPDDGFIVQDGKGMESEEEDGEGDEIQIPDGPPKKLGPMEIKQLKSDITEKLTEMGIPVPQNSTLKTLQGILRKAEK